MLGFASLVERDREMIQRQRRQQQQHHGMMVGCNESLVAFHPDGELTVKGLVGKGGGGWGTHIGVTLLGSF